MHLEQRSFLKAALSGAAGGAVGTAAKRLAESLAAPKAPDGRPVRDVHWTSGIALGAVYGVLAEYFPHITSRGGAEFGVALWAFARQIGQPGRAPLPAGRAALFERGSELSSPAVYGLITELGRKTVRSLLD